MNRPAPPSAGSPAGLSQTQRDELRTLIQTVVPAASLWLFGSRAAGHARPFSDVDVLMQTTTPLSWAQRANLAQALEDSTFPFRVDVLEERSLSAAMKARVHAEKQVL